MSGTEPEPIALATPGPHRRAGEPDPALSRQFARCSLDVVDTRRSSLVSINLTCRDQVTAEPVRVRTIAVSSPECRLIRVILLVPQQCSLGLDSLDARTSPFAFYSTAGRPDKAESATATGWDTTVRR